MRRTNQRSKLQPGLLIGRFWPPRITLETNGRWMPNPRAGGTVGTAAAQSSVNRDPGWLAFWLWRHIQKLYLAFASSWSAGSLLRGMTLGIITEIASYKHKLSALVAIAFLSEREQLWPEVTLGTLCIDTRKMNLCLRKQVLLPSSDCVQSFVSCLKSGRALENTEGHRNPCLRNTHVGA